MVGIAVVARLGSKRLADKHLIPESGKTLLEWLIARLKAKFSEQITKGDVKIFIATSVKPENKEFEKYAASSGIEVFYGSDDNIPLRLFESAKHFGLTHVINIDGDDILCSPHAVSVIYNSIRKTNNDYIITSGLPLGLNASAFSYSLLEKAIAENRNKKLETGWGKIFSQYKPTTLVLGNRGKDEQLRFTLDYEEDAEFFKKIIAYFRNKILDATDEQIINYVLEKELFKINASLNQRYWDNFYKEQKDEKK